MVATTFGGDMDSAKERARLLMIPSSNGVVDDERPICAYPDLAAYSGPAGGQNDRANWVRRNFRRR